MQRLEESGMNDQGLFAKPGSPQADLSAIGIVEKEQGIARCSRSQHRSNFQLTYCYYSFFIFFCDEPFRTSLRGLRRQSMIIHAAFESKKLDPSTISDFHPAASSALVLLFVWHPPRALQDQKIGGPAHKTHE